MNLPAMHVHNGNYDNRSHILACHVVGNQSSDFSLESSLTSTLNTTGDLHPSYCIIQAPYTEFTDLVS